MIGLTQCPCRDTVDTPQTAQRSQAWYTSLVAFLVCRFFWGMQEKNALARLQYRCFFHSNGQSRDPVGHKQPTDLAAAAAATHIACPTDQPIPFLHSTEHARPGLPPLHPPQPATTPTQAPTMLKLALAALVVALLVTPGATQVSVPVETAIRTSGDPPPPPPPPHYNAGGNDGGM